MKRKARDRTNSRTVARIANPSFRRGQQDDARYFAAACRVWLIRFTKSR